MLTLELPGLAATDRLGAALAAALRPPALVTLTGELGTGKTTLVRFLLRARGVTAVVTSPSFTLAQSYRDREGVPIHHLDLYRLTPGPDADLFAWDDYLTEEAITLVEWPEAGSERLPAADVAVCLEHRSPTVRAASISALEELEAALRDSLCESGPARHVHPGDGE